jgi:AraC-like DNA-binding protein
LPDVAEQLGQTTRTLQRKLKEAGSSFQEVLDQTRRELAEHYLAQAELSITDIAYMLGFQEQSSFNHAFKDWTGVNPGAFRAQRVNR